VERIAPGKQCLSPPVTLNHSGNEKDAPQ